MSTKCEDYRLKLEAHLAGLQDDAARHAFCGRLLDEWVVSYAKFRRAVSRGEAVNGTAAEFLTTLSDVATLREKFAPALQGAA